ncbi:hypothetical protein [Heyndrickxia oleronia]|uniref:Uncharacterized protein n=1 Tax=Heyndrickxia oleronia TaxID=38875 RepID=A0AAW6SSD7_9BACI|nr:hypothetical protein [Heyndrickxia oleronia]MDH5159884.1 hypothetical protein [Heyndrickxia oleronia]
MTQSNAYIRTGQTRAGFSLVFHELFDLYHPYIGDKATLYYLYLLRHRNNEQGNANEGKAWNGRTSTVEKFQLSFSTLPILDDILEASGLVTIERKPVGRGKDKIYYVVHDPLDRHQFRQREEEMTGKLRKVAMKYDKAIGKLLGKEKGAKLIA